MEAEAETMTTRSVDSLQRSAAKIFGLTYLPSFVLLVAVNFGILQPLIANLDPAQAAKNILAHETLFRVGLVGFVLYCVAVLVVSAALYVIFKPIDENLALLAAFGRLVHGLTWLLVALNHFTALRLLSRPEYAGFPADQLPVLARLYLSGFDQYYVGLLFWSLAATLGACLWLKTRYVPSALAIFGILASAWCAVCTSVLLISPGFSKVVNLWAFDTPMALFEIALSLLLLFGGLRPSGGARSAIEPQARSWALQKQDGPHNHPAPGKAGTAPQSAIECRLPGLPEPGRSAK